jgi:hypothetical protein
MTNQQLQEAATEHAADKDSEVHYRIARQSFLAGAAHMQAQSAGVSVDERDRFEHLIMLYLETKHGLILANDDAYNFIRFLRDKSPTTGGESEAVAFAEWCRKNYSTLDSGLYDHAKKDNSWYTPGSKEAPRYTTAELYAIYKQL